MGDDGRDLAAGDEAIGQLRADFEDRIQTVLARQHLRPTGDIEEYLGATAKPGTLLLNGQTVNRADYPALWTWVQGQGLAGVGKPFGTGDNASTFVLPNYAGKIARGVGSGETVGQLTGADSITLTTAQLPSHNHSVTVADHATHSHGGITAQDGAHGGHFPGSSFTAAAGTDYGLAAWNSGGVGSGTHNHGFATDSKPVSSHVVSQSPVGSGAAVDVRQAAFAVNWLIYT